MRQEDLPKANAKCVICGSPYYVCKRCIELRDKGIYGWKLFADGMQCYQLKLALDEYIDKRINKAEAKQMIDNIVFYPEMPNVIGKYKEVYDEIFSEDVPVETHEESISVEETETEVKEQPVVMSAVVDAPTVATQTIKHQKQNRSKQIKKQTAKIGRKH